MPGDQKGATLGTTQNDVKAVSAGGRHSLALTENGTVVAWGDNDEGQSTVPQGLNDVQVISAGGSHSVALVKD